VIKEMFSDKDHMAQLRTSESIPVPLLVTDPAAGPTTEADLSRETLHELEAIIESSLQSYVAIGTALRAIRDGRHYRKDNPRMTFEQYCAERWNFARQTAYDYLKGSLVAENVRASVQSELSLSQAVELASLEPDQQRGIAEAILAAGRSFQEVAVLDLRNIVQDVKSGSSPADAVDFAIGTCAGTRNDDDAVPDPPKVPCRGLVIYGCSVITDCLWAMPRIIPMSCDLWLGNTRIWFSPILPTTSITKATQKII
jgi:hypothetical protein